MSYVKRVIQPGETIIVTGRLSWIVYLPAICFLILGGILVIVERIFAPQGSLRTDLIYATAVLFGAVTIVSAFRAWFRRWTTEIAVTDKRIIYKRGFITRHTAEMNMDKVSSVDVDQSIWGRMLDFGSIHILGAGGAAGIEHLHLIASPIALRNAIDAR
jgi:uncharacterized membrane protein YdbT with pleckstrin-like domain